jgi:hypothetical protein
MNYPPHVTLRPITAWPMEFTRFRRRAPFRSSFSDTIGLLERELRLLDPDDPNWPTSVLQIALREQDFRLDGMPRASAVTEHPGVILNVESRNKPPLSFPCDTFTHWHDNLRAIALTLEALRKVDLYGVTQTGQQYRGWQAIEATASSATPRAALELLCGIAGIPADSDDGHDSPLVYRKARHAAHPDRHNGDQALWNQVETAGKALRAAGWLD